MYGQMTAGSWIYIGTQGILQGTYETFAELARQHFGGTLRGPGRRSPPGLGGMGGAQPLAVTMNDGVCLAIEVDEARRAAPARHRLRRPAHARRRTRRSRGRAARPRPASAMSIALVGNAAEIEPAWAPGRRAVRRRHRPDLGPRRARRLRARPRSRSTTPASCAGRQPDEYVRRSMRVDGRPRPGDARVPGRRRRRLRLRQQPPRPGPGGRRRERLRLPGLRPGVHPAAVLRGSRAVPVGGARRATRRTSPGPTRRSSSCSPTTRACAAGSRWPRRRSRSRACRRGSAGWATASGRGPGLAFNDLVARGRGPGADRHRPRPPRRGLRRLAEPRDGGDGRRLRRGRRLAAPQRARQHRGRRDVGLDPPRRRRRASATASTRGWSSSPTARSSRRRSWSGS